MSQRILERISRFLTFDDFASAALKALAALAVAWAILLAFFV